MNKTTFKKERETRAKQQGYGKAQLNKRESTDGIHKKREKGPYQPLNKERVMMTLFGHNCRKTVKIDDDLIGRVDVASQEDKQ